MSRAGWAATLFIGAALGLGLYLLTRGLPDYVHEELKITQEMIASAQKTLDTQQSQLDSMVDQDKAYMEKRAEVTAARADLKARQGKVSEAVGLMDGQVAELIKSDRHGDASKVLSSLFMARDAVKKAGQGAAAPLQGVQQAFNYKQFAKDFEAQVARDKKRVGEVIIDPRVDDGLQKVAEQFPAVRGDLEKEVNQLRSGADTIQKEIGRYEGMLSTKPPDYVARGQLAGAINRATGDLSTRRDKLLLTYVNVPRSIDRILVDMKKEGSPPRCFHKYKLIEDQQENTTGWEVVDCGYYSQHTDHLGMALYSKAAGELEGSANTVASPPGYNYVGRDRYGYWQGTGPSRIWIFYPRYYYMHSLYWGPGYYRPVSYGYYNSYTTSRRAGRAWYGSSRQYGTSGSITRKRYSNSRFVQRQASSSSRSGGYRSSRYSSGSRFGGGK